MVQNPPRRFRYCAATLTGTLLPTLKLLLPLLAAGLCVLIAKSGTAEALRRQPSPVGSSRSAQPLPQQGTQAVLNGRSLNIPWSQRQQQIGISDASLIQAFGADLLDTRDPTRQPIQWFSQPAIDSLILTPWLSGQYRYLDITQLAQRSGWQIRATAASLQISTPAAQITNVRQGRQDWGDRIVVDLDRATPWQVSEQGSEMVVAIDARVDSALVQRFVAVPGNRITALKVESGDRQTRIRIAAPDNLRPQIWTLPNPNRLVIDLRADAFVPQDIAWAPGVRWQQQIVRTSAGQFPVISLALNLRQPGLTVKPIWSDPTSTIGTAPLATIAQRWQAIAAINGGYFNRNNRLPLGAIRQDNRWLSGPILNRGAIGWNSSGDVTIGRLSIQESITTSANQRFPVLAFNSGYVQAGIARYTPGWGATYTPILDNEVLVTVQNDRVVSQQRSGAAGQGATPIPANGYLLVVRSYTAAANALASGTIVTLASITTPNEFDQFPQIVGAGPLLIQNRQVVLNAQSEQFTAAFIGQAAVRSTIATTADENLLFVTVQNRLGGLGPTLPELAQIMQQMGAVNALNLDGGSSTTLYLGGQLLNRDPRTAARVHNGIGVFVQPASGRGDR